jgi:hypothetical protein
MALQGKTMSLNILARYKARLVEKRLHSKPLHRPTGHNKAPFAPLSLVAALDLEIILLDIKTAFLYGEPKEELNILKILRTTRRFCHSRTRKRSLLSQDTK